MRRLRIELAKALIILAVTTAVVFAVHPNAPTFSDTALIAHLQP